MNLWTKITVYSVIMASCLFGCAYQRSVRLKPTDLPEHIYTTPEKNYYSTKKVAIFKFSEPPYAQGMGRAAAETLYEELLRNRVFVNVTPELDLSDIRMEGLIDIARTKNYDLIITGDLLYYFEGSIHQPSRVDERIRVIHVATNNTLWYAEAVDIAPPAPFVDYILIEGRGARAPTAMGLLNRNAEKFCKMLLNLPPQEFSDGAARGKKLSRRRGDRASSQ